MNVIGIIGSESICKLSLPENNTLFPVFSEYYVQIFFSYIFLFYPSIEIISEENDYVPTENDVDLIYPAGKSGISVLLMCFTCSFKQHIAHASYTTTAHYHRAEFKSIVSV